MFHGQKWIIYGYEYIAIWADAHQTTPGDLYSHDVWIPMAWDGFPGASSQNCCLKEIPHHLPIK
jgi:hypothetical protein